MKVHHQCQQRWEEMYGAKDSRECEWSCREHHKQCPLAGKLERAVVENVSQHGPPIHTGDSPHESAAKEVTAGHLPAQAALASHRMAEDEAENLLDLEEVDMDLGILEDLPQLGVAEGSNGEPVAASTGIMEATNKATMDLDLQAGVAQSSSVQSTSGEPTEHNTGSNIMGGHGSSRRQTIG
jgi:hypothetical protein